MQNVISLLNRAAQMEVPVLLQGEVGVGKGALSEYIYSKSKRRKEHFITIPCASLPDDTMVAELFGLGPGSHRNTHRARPACWTPTAGWSFWMRWSS